MISSRQYRASLDEMHVRKAQELVEKVSGGLLGEASKSQVAKAARLAETCGSIIVFSQWMRYQAGRGQRFWSARIGNRMLVDEIIAYSQCIKSQVDIALGDSTEEEQAKAVMVELARFLGFLRRAIVAQSVGGGQA